MRVKISVSIHEGSYKWDSLGEDQKVEVEAEPAALQMINWEGMLTGLVQKSVAAAIEIQNNPVEDEETEE